MKVWVAVVSDPDDTTQVEVFMDPEKVHTWVYAWLLRDWRLHRQDEHAPPDWQTMLFQLQDHDSYGKHVVVKTYDLEPTRTNLDASYILKAKAEYMSDEIEFDDAPLVSIGGDGAFVQAWVWVEDDELSGLDLVKKHGYRITTAQDFVSEAPKSVVLEVIEGAGGLDEWVLWHPEPEMFCLTMPHKPDLVEEFRLWKMMM